MASIKEGTTELRHLRYFLAVADAGHFRRAADALHVSQPTLTHQIQQLETQMGSRLFDREARPIRLTAAGELLREHAMAIMRELASAREAISSLREESRGHLYVGVVATINFSIIPEAVRRFTTHHPGFRVTIRELPMTELEAEVRAGKLDLGVSLMHPRSAATLEMEPLFRESLVVVLPPDHALWNARKINLADILSHPLIMLAAGFCTRELVDESIVGLQLREELRPAIELNSIEGVLATVRRTGMATLLPAAAVSWSSYPDLRVVPLAASRRLSTRSVGLLWKRGSHRSAAARAFSAEIKALMPHDNDSKATAVRPKN